MFSPLTAQSLVPVPHSGQYITPCLKRLNENGKGKGSGENKRGRGETDERKQASQTSSRQGRTVRQRLGHVEGPGRRGGAFLAGAERPGSTRQGGSGPPIPGPSVRGAPHPFLPLRGGGQAAGTHLESGRLWALDSPGEGHGLAAAAAGTFLGQEWEDPGTLAFSSPGHSRAGTTPPSL